MSCFVLFVFPFTKTICKMIMFFFQFSSSIFFIHSFNQWKNKTKNLFFFLFLTWIEFYPSNKTLLLSNIVQRIDWIYKVLFCWVFKFFRFVFFPFLLQKLQKNTEALWTHTHSVDQLNFLEKNELFSGNFPATSRERKATRWILFKV